MNALFADGSMQFFLGEYIAVTDYAAVITRAEGDIVSNDSYRFGHRPVKTLPRHLLVTLGAQSPRSTEELTTRRSRRG
jgi:hypothetical protein